MTLTPDYSEDKDDFQPADEIDAPEYVLLGQTEHAGQTTDSGKGRIFPCEACGADLEFHIGDQKLKCPFCGAVKEIELQPESTIQEQNFHDMLERLKQLRADGSNELPDHEEVRCESCGANVVFTGTLTSSACPYCASPLQRENVHSATFRVPVDAVLPFLVEQRKATQLLKDWVKSLWFAPNDFKKKGAEGKFEGVYLPFWTFDSMTFTQYSGERGEHYYVTVGSGKNKRTERRTRWYPASGNFQRFFDDVLIVAARKLPMNLVNELEPWPLAQCIPFTQQVLAGYFARTYDAELDDGFVEARERIDRAIYSQVCRKIGGDTQRVHSVTSRYDAITYKHVLLPVWMLAYRYKDKPYRVFVNAATGEVQAERPWSWVKITLAVLAAIATAVTIYAITQR